MGVVFYRGFSVDRDVDPISALDDLEITDPIRNHSLPKEREGPGNTIVPGQIGLIRVVESFNRPLVRPYLYPFDYRCCRVIILQST